MKYVIKIWQSMPLWLGSIVACLHKGITLVAFDGYEVNHDLENDA
jgi:hypothetical protein